MATLPSFVLLCFFWNHTCGGTRIIAKTIRRMSTTVMKYVGWYQKLNTFFDFLGRVFFWFPSARTSILRGSKIPTVFSGRAILWTAPFWAGGFVNSMGVWPSTCTAIRCGWARCMFYVLCTSIHQHIETTVVCAAFVTWMDVLLFMPKGSHFAGVHTHRK